MDMTHAAKGLSLERTLIAVEPDGQHHWQVCIHQCPVARHATRAAALEQAKQMARSCHASFGVPTGVGLQMRCGDRVLVGACG